LAASKRPAAVFFDHAVNLGHEADGFVDGNDDALVVIDVFVSQRAAATILQPFLANLVAANVEVPDVLGHAAEADVPCVTAWPLFAAPASSQTVSSDQPTRSTSGLFGPV